MSAPVVVELRGELDLAVRDEVHDRLMAGAKAAMHDGAVLVVDLAGVTFMDSSGLWCITATRSHLTEAGGRLVLVNVAAQPRRVLVMTGLDHLCEDPCP